MTIRAREKDRLVLRANQVPVIAAVRQAFEDGHTRVLLQAATAFGKTTCFSHIAQCSAELGHTVHIIVHRDELFTQVEERLDQYGIEYGRIAPGATAEPWKKIQICTIQTYNIRIKKGLVKPADLYVIDEAHHAAANTYTTLWEFAPEAHFLGVTATPKRTDGKGLDYYEVKVNGVTERRPLFTKIVCADPMRTLIDQGALVEPWHFAPSAALDFSSVPLRDNDYDANKSLEVIEKSPIHGDMIKSYRELSPGRPAVAFCVNLKHCAIVAEAFNAAGIPAAVIDGTMSKHQRRRLIRQHKAGEILILCSANLITEGVDIPTVENVILLRKSKSIIMYLQMVGRGLRAYPGKTRCIVQDHVRFIDQPGFGLVDAPRTWTLEGTTFMDDEGVKQCESCWCWQRQSVKVCQSCGAEFATKASGGGASRRREYDYSAAKAAELKRYMTEAERVQEKKEAKERQRQRKLEEKQAGAAKDSYAAFLELARKRGLESPEKWARLQVDMRGDYLGFKRRFNAPNLKKRK